MNGSFWKSLRRFVAGLFVIGLTLCSLPALGQEQAERDREQSERDVQELTATIEASANPVSEDFEERGDAYMELRRYKEALADFTKAIELGRKAWLFEKRLFAAIHCGEYQLALSDARGLVRKVPPQPVDYAVLAIILSRSPDIKVRDPKEALLNAQFAEHLAGEDHRVVVVHLALASAYSSNGDFASAIVHQKQAIALCKGRVPSEFKEQLDAYEAGKEYPFKVAAP